MTITRHIEVQKPNRRKFLYYLGGAGLLLLAGEVGSALSRYLNAPISKYGTGSGIFLLRASDIPQTESAPIYFREGYCWLANIEGRLLALDAHCIHDTAQVKWVKMNQRYECPLCGSKFKIDGTYIEGPAWRSLERFVLRVSTSPGAITTSNEGDPLDIKDGESIELDMSQIIPGKPRA